MSLPQNIKSAQDAPFLKREWSGKEVDLVDSAAGNAFSYSEQDPTGLIERLLIEQDSDDQLRIGDAILNPTRQQLVFHVYPNASLVSQTFFVNPTPRQLIVNVAAEIHTTAGTGTTATATVTHECTPPGNTLQQAAGTGKAVITTPFNLKGTAETVQNGVLAANFQKQTRNSSVSLPQPNAGLITLQPGDGLSVLFAGALTTLVGVTITITVEPGSKYEFVSFYAGTAGTAVTTSLMTALRPRTLLYGAALWQAAETSAATLALDVTKDASGTAPGAGTSMLSATANLKGAALTYTQLALSATAANLTTLSTDSVAAKISASSTQLAGLCVTLAFDGKMGEVSINYNAFNSTVGTDEEIWIADRDYEVSDFAAKWSTVGSGDVLVTKEIGTQTPGTGGVGLQTDNTNAGFLTSGTINVPVFATLVALNLRFIQKGTRIGLHNSGTLGTLAGFQMSMRLTAK
jgi:hypothetical protein